MRNCVVLEKGRVHGESDCLGRRRVGRVRQRLGWGGVLGKGRVLARLGWGGVLAGLLFTIVTLVAVDKSRAADTFKIGVVDQQQVLERTQTGKRALEGLKEFSASRQKIVSADDEELKRLEKELKEPESTLSEAAKREKQELFRTKFENYQRRLQEFNREIQGRQKQLADDFQKRINQAAAAVGEKNGYAVVMDKGNESALKIVIYANEAIDLTEQVIKEFDRQNK